MVQKDYVTKNEGWLVNRLNDFSLYDWITTTHPLILKI